MLEGLVAWVLRTYIGEYVENLNTDKLSIGIYQGQVELENLPLRKDALKNLDLPIEVKSGFIGKVNLVIPWSRLNSAPWVITLEKIFLVAGPLQNSTYNVEEEEKAETQRKKQQLDALEEKWKVQKNMSPQGSSWWSYGTSSVLSAVTNIVENLQLHVKNVHLRYEDDSTIPGLSFAGGIVIKSLSAHSTDPNWIRQFVSRARTDLMHKLVDLQNFALYWDDHAKLVGDTPLTELEDVLSRDMYEHTVTGDFLDHQYILEPVCAQAKMKRNTSALPLRGQSSPRISMDLQLDKIPFELRESQYRGLVAWMREFDRFEKSRKYRRWRPTERVKDHAQEWWTFCTSAILHNVREKRRKCTKDYVLTRVRNNVLYVDAYEQHIIKGSYMDTNLAQHMKVCEEEWTFEETKLLREIALQRIDTRERKAQEAIQESSGVSISATSGRGQPPTVSQQQQQQPGLLRRWLPGWGGWYSQGSSETEVPPEPSEGEEPSVEGGESTVKTEKQIEQEILDVLGDSAENNTFLKRDTIFAKVNFCLQSAVVRLLSDSTDTQETATLLELVCSPIELEFETRPRTSGMKFGVSVGSLLLKDKFTKDSLMPVLVGPQMQNKENRQFLSGQLAGTAGRSGFQPLFSGQQTTSHTKSNLFQLIYEKKPFHSKADYKLEIKSKPLDIVYNPCAMQRIKQFFRSNQPGPSLSTTASNRYEELKRTTQAEFQQALGRFLEGDEQVKAKRWDFDMDIAAPQVILPESFTDSSKTLVVLDLGRFQFYNSSAQITDRTQREISEEDEYFVTPSSTPPNEKSPFSADEVTPAQSPVHPGVPKLEEVLVENLSESMVRDKIYDKYTVTLSDLQVMIGTARDNWKHAQTKGSSKLHVVDKFSISLRLERRLLSTIDPQWPKLTLAGSVQSLVLHVSEKKVNALNAYLTVLRETQVDDSPLEGISKASVEKAKTDFNAAMLSSVYPGKSPVHLSEKLAAHQSKVRQNVADSRLMLMQFSINSVSLEVQSRGRSIAELQVSGVRANYTRRPFDTSLSFTVHSLLVVDAIQTFGSDYELLVASHKNLWIDSMSGSIRDSDPNSPTSPVSPLSPHSPRSPPGSPAEMAKPMPSKGSFQTVGATVVSALQSLVTSTGREESKLTESEGKGYPPHTPTSLDLDGSGSFPLTLDTEALIKIELDVITPQCPSNSSSQNTLHIANVQFNNLDFVANQETITELLSFAQRLFPSSAGGAKQTNPSSSKSATSQKLLAQVEEASSVHWEFNADFHRLNVLLMRAEDQKASKVATVTMSNAKIKATLVGDLEVEGSLDGLQALNLTLEGKKHQKLFSMGIEPTMSTAQLDIWDYPKMDMYKTANESAIFETESFERALTFSFSKPGPYVSSSGMVTPTVRGGGGGFSPASTPSETGSGGVNTSREMVLVIRMASLNYTHSPTFLKEVSLCLTDFQDYMAGVGDSIKTAATEVAMGLVKSHTDMGTSMYASHMDTPTKKAKLPVVEESKELPTQLNVSTDSLPCVSTGGLKLDALFQTPVIILPKNPESSEVLVGHLGRISVKNYVDEMDEVSQSMTTADDFQRRDKMFVCIKEMTVYSVDLDQQEVLVKDKEVLNKSMFSTPIPGGKKKVTYGTPIVHNTMIELTVQKRDSIEEETTRHSDSMDFHMEDVSTEEISTLTASSLAITGRIVNQLKVALSKNVFEQILQTLDNIAPPDDAIVESSFSPRDFGRSSSDLHPSLSSLKLEESTDLPSFASSRDRSMSDVSSMHKGQSLVLNAKFELPSLVVEMTGDVGEGEQGLVDIKLQNFKVSMVKADPFVKDVEVFLQSLVVEDLLIDAKSKHRQLMVSHSSVGERTDLGVSQYLSTSCPTSVIEVPHLDMPPSLPSSLNRENVWDNVYDSQMQRGVTSKHFNTGLYRSHLQHGNYPNTPPPSVSHTPKHTGSQTSVSGNEGERLVHIKVKLVDKKSPVFVTKYNKTQRYIDVDFNKLDTTLNLQTWVVILDFLGMGAKAHDPEQFTEKAQRKQRHPSSQRSVLKGKEEVNSEVNLKIQSLTLILNKPEYELAKANIAKVGAHVLLRDGNFTAKGQLGSMSLLDISPYGNKYRERFITTGTQALDFDLHKYGTPDPDSLRECDVSLKLRMSSVCYVHTHRFVQELLAFAQNFNQLQDLLGQMRAATENRKYQDKAFRSARILLDIEAGAPIILIPHSSKDTDVLVMDLGNLTVHNSFIWAGSPGTIAYREQKGRQRSESYGRRDSDSTVRERSGTTDTLTEDPAGLPSSDVKLESPAPLDPMTQSTFGSLESDLRSDAFHSVYESSPDDEHLFKKQKVSGDSVESRRVRSSSLSGFYEAMGQEPMNTSLDPPDSPIDTPSGQHYRTKPPYSSVHSADSDQSFDPTTHICLLDAMELELSDIDLFSGEWLPRKDGDLTVGRAGTRLLFNTYVIERDEGKVLKEKGRLSLQVERNLEGDISHAEPDISVSGVLSSVHFSLDTKQFKLVKGMLFHNFGEPLETFQKKVITHFEDPKLNTVLSGNVWKVICLRLELDDVSTELLISHSNSTTPEVSLGCIHFLQSRLTFDRNSDFSKEIGLVSHQIRAIDTRYRDAPANVKPNVFDKILQPSKDPKIQNALQLEVHYRSSKTGSQFIVLLNNMRLMGVFDWLLAVKDYLTSPVEDPWKDVEMELSGYPPLVERQSSNVGVNSAVGIASKRFSSVGQSQEPPFSFNLNITDTDLVVMEDTADRDTSAVILKSTAILSYKALHKDKPLTCNLQSLEVFSCSLSAEDETALSIIDPMQVTLELNSSPMAQDKALVNTGVNEVRQAEKPPILEVHFTSLNIRLSYNDMKLFLGIINSMPKQLLKAQEQTRPKNHPPQLFSAGQVEQLESLGFSSSDCESALEATEGRLDDSAMWLTQHATPMSNSRQGGQDLLVSGIEVRSSIVSLCLIDDCLDADIPLIEVNVSNLYLLHKLDIHRQGKATFKLNGDYYNRSLSGWEPFLETWGCQLSWQQNVPGEENKLAVDVRSNDVLNFNLTRVFMEQYSQTQSKWTEEYFRESTSSEKVSKHRTPFVPFAIRNNTGCNLSFATLTTSPRRISLTPDSVSTSHKEIGEWRQVRPGDQLPFLIEEREKIRHKHTHELKVHQVVVAVEGWEAVAPVSLDKVGTYFRESVPKVDALDPVYKEMPPVRVVFDVTLEGSARKVITVRSALMVHNQLEDEVELAVDAAGMHQYKKPVLRLAANVRRPIPMPYVHSKLWCRPTDWALDWCNKPILWTHVRKAGEVNDSIRSCDIVAGEKNTYRFCVSVYRQHFPTKVSVTGTSLHGIFYDQPGHVITLVPPLRIENLLPVDLNFYLKGTGIRSRVSPGHVASVVAADLSNVLELGVNLENFLDCRELVVPPDTQDYRVKLRIYDEKKRTLELWVRILAGLGGSLTFSISAPYWLVNRTGLPLVFRQDSTEIAAGQFEEHEVARSVTPLLFCYADKESREKCSMRLGKLWVGEAKGRALWCHRFSLERGCGVRPVHIKAFDNRPDWVFNIGIDVRQGRGRYCDTNIVTFSPRYQLDNRSSYKLHFAQRHIAHRGQGISGDFTSALPQCTVSFHWPRVDKDQLLCVRVDPTYKLDNEKMKVTSCEWSGGFRIDHVNSCHVNMRGESNVCQFLRVDIVLHGATFYVVFSDAHHMPPPYRIDNFSEVPITYFQTSAADEQLRTTLRTNVSIPYAWDEPTLPPHITLRVQGGSSATYNMDVIRDGDQLCYENFIYISFSATFRGLSSHTRHMYMSHVCSSPASPTVSDSLSDTHRSWSGNFSEFVSSQELVLEVLPATSKVVLRKKESGNRFQLWRMTSAGLLQHEGTSAPRDPRRHSIFESSGSAMVSYVLDVQDIALQPGRETNLMIRKPDDRRRTTQMWQFTEDGRLCPMSSTHLCVQSKEGVYGLREGGEVVLSPSPPVMRSKDVPVEMQVSRQRMRPGSGLLSVKVITDGPTRVLQITDIKYQQYKDESFQDDWILVKEARKKPLLNVSQHYPPVKRQDLEVNFHLPNGLGISLVNKVPEELIYISLRDIALSYTSSLAGQIVDFSVKALQIDNQLFGTTRPILLYVTPSKYDPDAGSQPVLQISAHKVPNYKWHAHIFRHLLVSMKSLTLVIEEKLLWKLAKFFGVGQTDPTDIRNLEESSYDSQRALTAATSSQFARYYFGTLKIHTGQVNLSMVTALELSTDLIDIKKAMRLPLVNFDEAKVELDPFVSVHIFETSALLLESIRIHYTEELKSQAAKILGSVDFLGNPLGLFNDVTEGLSGLLTEGNFGGLLKNVTHGTFNTAAKVTGTVGDGLSYLSGDDTHQRKRQKIKDTHAGSSTGHIKAAFKGLGIGMVGGLTSIFTQTYSGAKNEGLEGLLTGTIKGVVGTVTKPVAGVLDFASETASAVRDTSKGSSRKLPYRLRRPRCSYGPGGLLPAYSEHHAKAQQSLFILNNNAYTEMFIALEQLRTSQKDGLQALISSNSVYFLGDNESTSERIMLKVDYSELFNCRCIPKDNKYYIELTMKVEAEVGSSSSDPKKRPLVRCDSETIAQMVVQQINYAKTLYEEKVNTLPEESERKKAKNLGS